MSAPRSQRVEINGWVILDKPVGMTSTHAVSRLKRIFNAHVKYDVYPKARVLSGKTGSMTSLMVNYFFRVYDFVLHAGGMATGAYDLSGLFMLLLHGDTGSIPPDDVAAIRRIVHTLRIRMKKSMAYDSSQLETVVADLNAGYSLEKSKPYALSGSHPIIFANYASHVIDPVSGMGLVELDDIFSPWEYRPWYVNDHMEFEQILHRIGQVDEIFNG